MTTRDKLVTERDKIESKIAAIEAKLDALESPQTATAVKRRIAIWNLALKYLDDTATAKPGSPERLEAISKAFGHVRANFDREELLGQSPKVWAKVLSLAEQEPEGTTAATRLKFSHLAQASVTEFKEREKPQEPPRFAVMRKKLREQRAALEEQLMAAEAKIAAFDVPKAPKEVKRRINVWKAALKFIDAVSDAATGSPSRQEALRNAFNQVRRHFDSETILGQSIAAWSRAFLAEEQKPGMTNEAIRLKLAHLAQVHVKEYRERTQRGVPRRGSPVEPWT